MPQREYALFTAVIDSGVDTTKTTAVQVPAWARYASVYIPNITNAAVTMEMALNEDIGYPTATSSDLLPTVDTYWFAYADEAESSQIAASGVENTWVDISHFIKAMAKDAFIRFVQGAAETGGSALTYKVAFRGA